MSAHCRSGCVIYPGRISLQGLCTGSGIGELMEDLGLALAAGGERMCMLGGGQPAHIPEIDAVWRRRMEEIMAEDGA